MEAALPYILAVLGFLMIHTLTGIEKRLGEIKGQISKVADDLHDRVTAIDLRHQDKEEALDRRLSQVEARCAVVHKQ